MLKTVKLQDSPYSKHPLTQWHIYHEAIKPATYKANQKCVQRRGKAFLKFFSFNFMIHTWGGGKYNMKERYSLSSEIYSATICDFKDNID